ncbi:hypothetical protein PIB30_099844, partial [Stylosanthes scabra]|nr:hypothetical protein [Stylosanthes scabra]
GKELEDNYGPKLELQAEDKAVEDSLVTSATKNSAEAKPTNTPSSSPSSKKEMQIPFPHRLNKDGKDQQFSMFLQIFKKL